MRLKTTFFLLAVIFLWSCKPEKTEIFIPSPTETQVKWDMEDGNKPDRKAWIESLHRSAPDVVWKNIETQNSKDLAKYRKAFIESNGTRDPGVPETIVENHLSGAWFERGSNNQSGNVLVTDYDVAQNAVYTISAGGNLWKGILDGSEWQAINQDLRFNDKMLHLLPGGRILAAINGQPHYSDDDGETWELANGIDSAIDNWATVKHSTKVTRTDGSVEIFVFHKRGYWENIKLYYSADGGEEYIELFEAGTSDMDSYALCNPTGTTDLYMMEELNGDLSNIYKWDMNTVQLELVTADAPISFQLARGNLNGYVHDNDVLRLVIFIKVNDNNEIFYSDDLGESWNFQGTLPINPWDVGLFISPSDPDLLLTGGVEAYRSHDGGQNWFLVNGWGEYYEDVENKIHADIMFFNEFEDQDGNPFILTSNHGGMSISYDYTQTNRNIALAGLNVSQYYSVASSPLDHSFIFAGSQDQGFQRGRILDPFTTPDFDQVISGDYGHIIFTKNHTRLWTVYPGGWVTYYNSPFFQGYSAAYDLSSPDESVWIPPLMPHPDDAENIAYMAGGNINGQPGRHIIEMEYANGIINVDALPFDFSVSGGNISAMATNHFNNDYWYVATDNGRIYVSDDGGISFDLKQSNVAGGHYLYGSDILPSKLNENVLYLSGSGYSTAGVIRSVDNGESWQAMDNGLPQTMVFALAANDDESLLFAATEAGPFVYIAAEDLWYPLSGSTAPNTTYWSVQFVPITQTARFGTYGRGVWDFEITGTSSNEEVLEHQTTISLYPNPTVDQLNVNFDNNNEEKNISILNMNGVQMYSKLVSSTLHVVNVSDYPEGSYILQVRNKDKVESKIFIKAN